MGSLLGPPVSIFRVPLCPPPRLGTCSDWLFIQQNGNSIMENPYIHLLAVRTTGLDDGGLHVGVAQAEDAQIMSIREHNGSRADDARIN